MNPSSASIRRSLRARFARSSGSAAPNGLGFARAFSVFAPAAAALALVGCQAAPLPRAPYTLVGGDPQRRAEVPDITQTEWTVSRARLARMRGEQPKHPYVERVRVAIADPRTNKVYEARGAVAVSPDSAARLVLLGPGGTTAIDLWVTKDRFKIAIPTIHYERRGGGDDDASGRDLPIGLLRWWFLSPLRGDLLLARATRAEAAFLIRDDAATVTMRTDGERFVAVRRQGESMEGIEWVGRGLVPRAGARGRYIDGRWGIRVDILVEEVLDKEPDPAAFLDPDDKGTAL